MKFGHRLQLMLIAGITFVLALFQNSFAAPAVSDDEGYFAFGTFVSASEMAIDREDFTFDESAFKNFGRVMRKQACELVVDGGKFKPGTKVFIVLKREPSGSKLVHGIIQKSTKEKTSPLKISEQRYCNEVANAPVVKKSDVKFIQKKKNEPDNVSLQLSKILLDASFGVEDITQNGLSYAAPLDDGKKLRHFRAALNVEVFPFLYAGNTYLYQMFGLGIASSFDRSTKKSDITYEGDSKGSQTTSLLSIEPKFLFRFPFLGHLLQTRVTIAPYSYSQFSTTASGSASGSPLRSFTQTHVEIGIKQSIYYLSDWSTSVGFTQCLMPQVTFKNSAAKVKLTQCFELEFESLARFSSLSTGLRISYSRRVGTLSYPGKDGHSSFQFTSLVPTVTIGWQY